jgi:hypothetical protein
LQNEQAPVPLRLPESALFLSERRHSLSITAGTTGYEGLSIRYFSRTESFILA